MLHALLALGLLAGVVTAQQPTPASAFSRWEIVDPGGRAMPYLGRDSLFLSDGVALMPDVAFADGVIAFDVAMHGQAGFAGVVLRSQSPDDYELIDLRTHRSRQWDALQYTPVFGRQEAWQCLHWSRLHRRGGVAAEPLGARRGGGRRPDGTRVCRPRRRAAADGHRPQATAGAWSCRTVGPLRCRQLLQCDGDRIAVGAGAGRAGQGAAAGDHHPLGAGAGGLGASRDIESCTTRPEVGRRRGRARWRPQHRAVPPGGAGRSRPARPWCWRAPCSGAQRRVRCVSRSATATRSRSS